MPNSLGYFCIIGLSFLDLTLTFPLNVITKRVQIKINFLYDYIHSNSFQNCLIPKIDCQLFLEPLFEKCPTYWIIKYSVRLSNEYHPNLSQTKLDFVGMKECKSTMRIKISQHANSIHYELGRILNHWWRWLGYPHENLHTLGDIKRAKIYSVKVEQFNILVKLLPPLSCYQRKINIKGVLVF